MQIFRIFCILFEMSLNVVHIGSIPTDVVYVHQTKKAGPSVGTAMENYASVIFALSTNEFN